MRLFPRNFKLKLPHSLSKIRWASYTGIAAAATVLLFCAWLPSRFIDREEGSTVTAPPAAPSESATQFELWQAYRAGTMSAQSVNLKEKDIAPCRELATDIRVRLTLDIGEEKRSAGGEECLRVGERLTMYHVWEEWTGDWSNWLEIFIDMDTKEVYYFYISSICEQNFDRYQDAISSGFDAPSAAKLWGDVVGIGSPSVSWSGDPDEPAEAVYGTARYRIQAKYYFDADYPTGLFDMKALRTR